jgi:CelD/BcsL family acetyltransferase involved in cellulose biosynthesis
VIERASIDFTVGSRRLFSVRREVARWSFSLEDLLSPDRQLAPPPMGREGFRILSAPRREVANIEARFPGLLIGGRQDYRRHYIDMSGSFEDYLARFSGKTRSTFRRKARKLAEEAGDYRVTLHRTPEEVSAFLDAALPLSARTYQARLLDAGLPASDAAREQMIEAAHQDRLRCFLFSIEARPIAYLSLPIVGSTLFYAHLGYDPDYARLSPGTVLQLEALERLFAEGRFAYFDFTEGDGAHKAMFGTDHVECSSFLLLQPSLANRALLSARGVFDGAVSEAKVAAQRLGLLQKARSVLRA